MGSSYASSPDCWVCCCGPGLQREMDQQPIEIQPYSKEWIPKFDELGCSLRSALGGLAIRIDHIGSTSVPGLAAKPIIDIQVSVGSLEPVDVYRTGIEAIGYEWRRDNPEMSKRYFRERPGGERTHIHVRKFGSWHEQFALLFRDYLRAHADARDHYERAKRQLAVRFRHDRQGYTDAKAPVIWEIMRSADRWAAAAGWEPGSADR